MKKIMKLFLIVAAAAMTFVSCQKNEFDTPIKKEVQFTINAGIAQTKTVITDNGDKTYTPSWTNGDKIGLFFTEPTSEVSKVDAVFENQAESGEVAQFSGTASVAESGTFYAFYPSSAFGKHYGDGTIRLDLSILQKPTSTSYDPAYDILVAKPCEYVVEEGNAVIDDLYFTRLMSVLRVNLNGDFAQGEIVESLSISVEGVDIAGNAVVDYKTAEIVKWNNGSAAKNVVTADYSGEDKISIAGTNNSSYLIVAPVTIPEGTNITFEINTKKYVITKTVAAPSDMTFFAGNVSVINLTILEENCEAVDTSIDYSGEYFIAGKEGEAWYAAKKYLSGNYLSVSPLEFDEESIVETEGLADCYMTITKVVGGDYDGMYTIVDAGGKYLSPSSSSSNNMKAVESTSDNTYWTISKVDETGTYSMVATKSEYSRKDMRFNYNQGSNPRVSCYDGSKTSQPYLTLFSTELVKTDPTPKIVVTETEQSIGAEGGELTFAYTLKNLDGKAVTVDEASDFLSADAADGTVTVTVDANETTEAREATITLTCGSAEDVTLTVTQEGQVVVDSSLDGKYWIYEPTSKIVMAPIAESAASDRPENGNAEVENEVVSSFEKYAFDFTFDEEKNAYTIQDSYGRYIHSGYYNGNPSAFVYASASLPEGESGYWGISKSEDKYVIVNKDTNYELAYDSSYSNWSLYAADHGKAYPTLVKADNPLSVELSSISVSGQKTSFTVGDAFEFDGTVTATYNDGSTKTVTPTSVSTPDMTEGKHDVTVTYVENNVSKSVEYTITVNAAGGNEGESVVKGAAYTYSFTAKQFTANGEKALGNLNWILAGDGGYWGYDGTKGQQLGSGNKPYKSMTFSTSGYEGGVEKIVINTSGASSINATFTVTVNGVQYGASTKLTTSATEYTFEVNDADMQAGDIVFTYSQTSSKAIYIKSIAIN